VVQAFKDERIAILNADAVRSVRGDSPAVFEKLVVRRGVVGAGGRVNVSAVQVGVGAQTKHPELAAKLAWALTSPKWQERLCREASRVPSTVASLGLAEFAMPEDRTDKLRLAMGIGAEQLREGRARSFVPETGQWPEMERVFSDEIKRVLLEGADVGETLDRIDGMWTELLKLEARLGG
jgi:ABC-type glycerol-3-phosphate transport system substrate-binding protein